MSVFCLKTLIFARFWPSRATHQASIFSSDGLATFCNVCYILQCMLAEKKAGVGGGGVLVGLQDYSVLQASKLKHLDKRVSNF